MPCINGNARNIRKKLGFLLSKKFENKHQEINQEIWRTMHAVIFVWYSCDNMLFLILFIGIFLASQNVQAAIYFISAFCLTTLEIGIFMSEEDEIFDFSENAHENVSLEVFHTELVKFLGDVIFTETLPHYFPNQEFLCKELISNNGMGFGF